MMQKSLIKTSRFLSRVLRHAPERIEITLDKEGWTDIDTLIRQANVYGSFKPQLTRARLDEIVANNDKKRFEISYDGSQIRAVQGHSTTQVDRSFAAKIPPNPLYHGSAQPALNAIMREGLTPQSRQYVHLSADVATAKKVGARHGQVVVLLIDTEAMLQQGHVFYQAENGVWLVKAVPPTFITIRQD